LREKLWEPIEAKLGGAKIVLVSPDGALSRLPLAALPGKEAGHYLIEDYAIAIVPTAQVIPELVQDEGRKPLPKNLLIMGNIDYDAEGVAIPDAPANPIVLASRAPTDFATFRPLPATEAEVAAIARLCPQESASGSVTRLEKAQASKAAFLAEAGKHRYLHLATHGFFIEENLPVLPGFGAREQGRFGEMLHGPRGAEMHPALRCGLALAGANRATRAGAGDPLSGNRDDSGILTAEEIGTQNLEGVQLVVLSACESGLGKQVSGEGLLGLQRAFQSAGARNVVASLWPVDDQATSALMTLFYTKLWKENKPPLEALREAQLYIYHHPDEIGKPAADRGLGLSEPGKLPDGGAVKPGGKTASPEFWAGFVLAGVGK
jgi:CHAT domain-containing protein